MLSIDEIKALIKALDESSVDEMVYEADNQKLKLKKHTAPAYKQDTVQYLPQAVIEPIQSNQDNQVYQAASEQTEAEAHYDYEITSPMVGTFYRSESPDSDPYISVGDQISKGTIVCMIEAMKLFNEIESDVNGEVVEVVAENGELVEYGQPLFRIKLK